MALTIQRLGPGDEATLELLALDDVDFDLDGDAPLLPLEGAAAARFLANPAVLLWTAHEGSEVLGFVYCVVVPLRSGSGQELLLYEIGVRKAWRRRGVGRALLAQMEGWMRANGVDEVWVLGDNQEAVAFYAACGFAVEQEQPTYLVRSLSAAPSKIT